MACRTAGAATLSERLRIQLSPIATTAVTTAEGDRRSDAAEHDHCGGHAGEDLAAVAALLPSASRAERLRRLARGGLRGRRWGRRGRFVAATAT